MDIFALDNVLELYRRKWHGGNILWPSYTIRATIFELVFPPKKFPKTEYCPTKRKISLSSRT